MDKRIPSKFPGVRYRESAARKFKGRPERYYMIRYKKGGKSLEEGLGWESGRVSAEYANRIRSEIVQNIRSGNRPQSVAEMRELEDEKETAKQTDALENIKVVFHVNAVGRQVFTKAIGQLSR